MKQKISAWFKGLSVKDGFYLALIIFLFILTRIESCGKQKELKRLDKMEDRLEWAVLEIHAQADRTYLVDSLMTKEVRLLHDGLKASLEQRDLAKEEAHLVRKDVEDGYKTISELENLFK